MTGIAIPLSNVVLGLANIGTGIGFGTAEQEKIDELGVKATKLQNDINTAGNFYDHIYYPVVVNLQRVKKSLDKLPNDMVKNVQDHILSDIQSSSSVEAIETMAEILGYIEETVKLGPDFLEIILYLRNKNTEGDQSGETPSDNSFEMVPMGDDEAPRLPTAESSFNKTPMLENVENGLNIVAIIFGVAGLAVTIGLGVWTLDKLTDAITNVEEKQVQVNAYLAAMKKALDPVVKHAGLTVGSYGDLTKTVMPTWKKTSEDFESYAKTMYYAIRGYIMEKEDSDIQKLVDEQSDTDMPYPQAGYPIAEKLAIEIKNEFGQKKTDKEIVAYIANEYSDENLRFVLDEYFISSLRLYT